MVKLKNQILLNFVAVLVFTDTVAHQEGKEKVKAIQTKRLAGFYKCLKYDAGSEVKNPSVRMVG